jgi:hypothetical protein
MGRDALIVSGDGKRKTRSTGVLWLQTKITKIKQGPAANEPRSIEREKQAAGALHEWI